MTIRSGMAAFAGLVAPCALLAATNTHTWNGGSGNWDDTNNWSSLTEPTGIPDDSDDAAILPSGTDTVLQDRPDLRLESLVLGDTFLVLVNDEQAQIFGSDPSTWTGGTIRGTGSLTLSGSTMTLSSSGRKWVLGGQQLIIEDTGTFVFGGGAKLRFEGPSVLINRGTFQLVANRAIDAVNAGGATITNEGTFEKTAGTGVSAIELPFDNTGHVSVSAGRLSIQSSFDHDPSTGSLTAETGGTLDLRPLGGTGQVLQDGTVVYGAGQLLLAGNLPVSFPGTASIVPATTLEGPVVEVAGELDLLGPLAWGTGVVRGAGVTRAHGDASFTGNNGRFILQGQEFVSLGTITHQGSGDLRLDGTSLFRNEGTYDLQGGADMNGVAPGGTGDFENLGTFRKSGGNESNIELTFQNSGTVHANVGSLRIDAYTQTAGTLRIDAGANFRSDGGVFTGGRVEGSGTLISPTLALLDPVTVAPGASAGVLTVDGDYSQVGGGELEIEIGGPVPGSSHDQLVVTGDAALGGTLRVTTIDGFQPDPEDVFDVLTAVQRTGVFEDVIGADVIYEDDRVRVMPEAGVSSRWAALGVLGALARRRRIHRGAATAARSR